MAEVEENVCELELAGLTNEFEAAGALYPFVVAGELDKIVVQWLR